MLESNVRAMNKDLNTIIKDAQTLFQDAAALTGEKAVEARQRGMRMLDSALVCAHEAQVSTIMAGKEMAASADHYVKDNPWKALSAAASIGLLLGVILGRK